MSSTEKFYQDLIRYIDGELEISNDDGITGEDAFAKKIISDMSEGDNPIIRGYDDEVFRYENIGISYCLCNLLQAGKYAV